MFTKDIAGLSNDTQAQIAALLNDPALAMTVQKITDSSDLSAFGAFQPLTDLVAEVIEDDSPLRVRIEAIGNAVRLGQPLTAAALERLGLVEIAREQALEELRELATQAEVAGDLADLVSA